MEKIKTIHVLETRRLNKQTNLFDYPSQSYYETKQLLSHALYNIFNVNKSTEITCNVNVYANETVYECVTPDVEGGMFKQRFIVRECNLNSE